MTAFVKKDTRLDNLLKKEIDMTYCGNQRLKNLSSVILAFNPDIIHLHLKDDLINVAILKRILILQFKVVHTRQMDFPGSKKNPYHWFIYSSIDLIITITDRLKHQMKSNLWINERKIKRLYYGVPDTVKSNLRCQELKINPSHFNIAIVGRIDEKKDQLTGIEAFRLVESDNASLYLIGGITDKSYGEKISARINEMKLQNIIITGFIDNPQEIMGCLDLIILTTPNETFGLVLPEAMRAGVAVIGANGGGVPEIIEDKVDGLLFDPGNPESLKSAIVEMMDDEKRLKYLEAAKIKADKLFNLNSHYNSLERIFQDLVNA